MLVTLTSEQSKLHHALSSVRFEGQQHCNYASALQVAQLILKNRQNSNQHQRIVLFVGSPLLLGSQDLAAIGKLLKKNGVALDIISFAHVADNEAILNGLLASVAGLDPKRAKDNILEALLDDPNCECHLLTVAQPGQSLTDALVNSSVLVGSDGSIPAGTFAMDDDMDPELALVILLCASLFS